MWTILAKKHLDFQSWSFDVELEVTKDSASVCCNTNACITILIFSQEIHERCYQVACSTRVINFVCRMTVKAKILSQARVMKKMTILMMMKRKMKPVCNLFGFFIFYFRNMFAFLNKPDRQARQGSPCCMMICRHIEQC